MSKLKLGVIFGGLSTEHEVSVVSGTSVIKNLNKEKYEIIPIFITKDGQWYFYTKKIDEIEILDVGTEPEELEKIPDVFSVLGTLDVAFPVLHGLYGEDGTIQGMLELLKVPYVGCKVLASSVCMDKAYTKAIFKLAGINQVDYVYLRTTSQGYQLITQDFSVEEYSIMEVVDKIMEKLHFPVFVKPSNSGSSVGICKSMNKEELRNHIEYAKQFDQEILIENGVNAKEVECSVLGNEKIKVSCPGEVLPAEDFYTFDAKYKNAESKVLIPANITPEQEEEIKKIAKKAFRAVNGSGLSRIDFFIDKDTSKIYLNEINTMPGFTTISMYPKLWEQEGISYSQLLDELINLSKK